MSRVFVVGSINVDLVVQGPELPGRGETVAGGTFAQHHGGKGANQAVAAARLGATVSMVGAVGDDEFGRSSVDDLRAEGIDATGVATLPNFATGVALIVVDAIGENQIAVASGANAGLEGPAVESGLAGAEPADVLVTNFELGDEAVVAAVRVASERGMKAIVNPAPARDLPGGLMALQPILVPNEGEAEALTGERDPLAGARVLCGRSGAPVIVTLGSRGALVFDGTSPEYISAPVVEAVDSTGAGDTFVGALSAQMAAGAGLLDAARFAVRAASLSVTVAGARGGMPTREQVEG